MRDLSFVRSFVPAVWLGMSLVSAAQATATSPESGSSEAKVLEGTWCHRDESGETVVRYSVTGWDVTAFTLLSESDPRRIGRQVSLHLTSESPTVFVRHDLGGADQVFSVRGEQLVVDTRDEDRQVTSSESYRKCDMKSAFERAQAFLFSPRAEEATRQALQREAAMQAAIEQQEREDAEVTERRNASRDAYYADLIRQLGQARRL